MGRKLLSCETKRAALARMEDAARSEDDFERVIAQWNHNDRNRERRVRYNEVRRPNAEMLHWDRINESDKKGKLKEGLDTVIPRPLDHPWWRQLMRGDFIDAIYDNASEMWQLIGNRDIAFLVKTLTGKQKEVLFSRAVRLCAAARVAYCHDKTDRAVRKLLVATLDSIRDKLAPLIREQIKAGYPHMTRVKREFLDRYDKEKAVLDSSDSE